MGRDRSDDHGRKRVLAQDVARHLGVSVSTVSRAFSASPSISEETRQKVLRTARDLGYEPDPFAGIMTAQHSNIVCVLVSEISNPFFPELVPLMTDELHKLGYAVMLFHIADVDGEEGAIRNAMRYKPQFIIITTAKTDFRLSDPTILKETQLICFNRYVPGTDFLAVTCDNFKGGYELADLLIGLGHRRPAYIAGTPDSTTSRDRGQGFSERCKMANIAVSFETSATSFSYECGYAAAKTLLGNVPDIDCIFCANDIMAMGTIDALRYDQGKRVPEDISVVGFDDVQMAAWPSFRLTTYRYPKHRMILELTDLITDFTKHPEQLPVNKIVVGEVVERGTHADRRPARKGMPGAP